MSTDLIQHAFGDHTVRTLLDAHGEPQFVLADLCSAIGIGNSRMVAQRLHPDGVSQADVIDSMGRRQRATVVTESGMFEVVLRSDSDRAAPFRKWVTTEVLPTLRKTGSYALGAQTAEQRIALAVIEAQALLAEKDATIAVLTPPAAAWNALADSAGDYSMRDAAQILSRDPGIEIGQNRLAKLLRQIGWIDPRGIPYQHHVQVGRLRSKPQTRISHRTGERVACEPQVRITLKGIEALHGHLHGLAPVQAETSPLAVAS
ncbi:phage antirepressor [Cellulomonas taurus]|uniref:phage antirepressor n=1 Tax=Cellulomonas taurus TaxID=2729175 RepID=UPI00145CDEA6|nr:phage antirepressor KilAC domain-containing protein [Cellulomonas taurus]